MSAHGHLGKPLAAVYRQHYDAVLIQNVHRAEGPAVDGNGLAVLWRSIAVALIIRIGLHNRRAAEAFIDELFYPRAGDNVGTVLFARVQLDTHLARQVCPDLVKDAKQSLRGQVGCEIDHRFLTFTVFIRDILVPIRSRNGLLFHAQSLLRPSSL